MIIQTIVKEKETIILPGYYNREYVQIFDMITDNNNKYIIIGSFSRFKFNNSGGIETTTPNEIS